MKGKFLKDLGFVLFFALLGFVCRSTDSLYVNFIGGVCVGIGLMLFNTIIKKLGKKIFNISEDNMSEDQK